MTAAAAHAPRLIGDDRHLFEFVGYVRVGPRGGRGKVPSALIRITHDRGQGGVRFAHCQWTDSVADGRTHEWMYQFDRLGIHVGDTGSLAGREVVVARRNLLGGLADFGDRRVERSRNDGHGSLSAGVEGIDAVDERANQVVSIAEVVGERRQPGQLIVIELPQKFAESERAAARCFDAALGHAGVGSNSQQRNGIIDTEALEVDGFETCVVERGWHIGALGDDGHHRLVG